MSLIGIYSCGGWGIGLGLQVTQENWCGFWKTISEETKDYWNLSIKNGEQ